MEREKQVRKIHNMLVPKPKELLKSPRLLVKFVLSNFCFKIIILINFKRYGNVHMKPVGSKTERKPRFLFLFHDALLITKREGNKQFRLRYFICLSNESKHRVEDASQEARPFGKSKKEQNH